VRHGFFFLHFLLLFYYLEVFCYFLFIFEAEGGHEFFWVFFNSWIGEVDVGFTFLHFYIFLILEGERGAWVFIFLIFFFKILHLKRGMGSGFIYSLFFIIIYILLSHFLPPARGRVAWVLFFFLFVIFFYCVLSFCYRFFTLTRGRGCEFIFHF